MEEIKAAISGKNLQSLYKLLENKGPEACCWALYYAIWELSRCESANQFTLKAINIERLVKELLIRGADVNIILDTCSVTIFGFACQFATVDIVKSMIDHRADVNLKDKLGRCPIQYAFESGDEKKINLLLDHGVKDIKSLNLLHKVGKVKIIDAQKELIRKLVRLGADVNSASCSAVDRSNLESIKFLIRSGTIVGKLEATSLLDRTIREGSKEMIELLLDCGANVNGISEFDHPLDAAVECGKEELVKFLLDRGARPDAKVLRYTKPTNQMEIADILLSGGFGANYMELGRPVLSTAVTKNNKKIVELLLEYRAQVNRGTLSTNCCPLHFAAQAGNIEIVKILIGHGADINSETRARRTALTIAHEGNKEEIYKFLIKQILFIKSSGLFVNKVNLDAIEAKETLAAFKKECVDELERLKSEKFDDSTLTYFDVLRINDIGKLAGLARNESITDVIKSNDFMIKFPLYTELIVDKLNKGSLRKKDFDLFKRFVNYLSTRKTDKLPNLPFTFVCDLFGYLTDRDIANLRKL